VRVVTCNVTASMRPAQACSIASSSSRRAAEPLCGAGSCLPDVNHGPRGDDMPWASTHIDGVLSLPRGGVARCRAGYG